jgi:alkylated DNA nucleotide flippase Atl1
MKIALSDAIVDIPENRIKFFGGKGKMLLPCPATVAALIEKIPAKKLITTNLICKELTKKFNVQGTCPVTTKKALQALVNDPEINAPYWRVLKTNGELMVSFPDSVEGQVAHLQKEGFTLETTGKVIKIKHFKESLVHFE